MERGERDIQRLARIADRRGMSGFLAQQRIRVERETRVLAERLAAERSARLAEIDRRIAADKDFARRWLAEAEQDEGLRLSPDWAVYFAMPISDDRDREPRKGTLTTDFITLNEADRSDRLWLEDAVIERIDKEREGYFTAIDLNSGGYALRVFNEHSFLPAKTDRALKEMRQSKSRMPASGRK